MRKVGKLKDLRKRFLKDGQITNGSYKNSHLSKKDLQQTEINDDLAIARKIFNASPEELTEIIEKHPELFETNVITNDDDWIY